MDTLSRWVCWVSVYLAWVPCHLM